MRDFTIHSNINEFDLRSNAIIDLCQLIFLQYILYIILFMKINSYPV